MRDSPKLVAVVVLLLALSVHALVTGRALSPSRRDLRTATVRLLGACGLAVTLLVYMMATDRAHERLWMTMGLAVLLAAAGFALVTGRARDGWGRVLSPAAARFWGVVGAAVILFCLARLWGCSP